jgi:hypothetical protein
VGHSRSEPDVGRGKTVSPKVPVNITLHIVVVLCMGHILSRSDVGLREDVSERRVMRLLVHA